MKFILGSGSRWRREILERAGYAFDVMAADIDEQSIRLENPEQLSLALARAKSAALLQRITEPVLLITSDQVIAWNDTIREKPKDAEEAREFLRSYAMRAPETVTSLVVTNTAAGQSAEGVDRVRVIFSPVPESVIDALIEKGLLFTAAGGFQVQDPLLKPYIHYDGTEDSCMGMPLALLRRLIAEVQ